MALPDYSLFGPRSLEESAAHQVAREATPEQQRLAEGVLVGAGLAAAGIKFPLVGAALTALGFYQTGSKMARGEELDRWDAVNVLGPLGGAAVGQILRRVVPAIKALKSAGKIDDAARMTAQVDNELAAALKRPAGQPQESLMGRIDPVGRQQTSSVGGPSVPSVVSGSQIQRALAEVPTQIDPMPGGVSRSLKLAPPPARVPTPTTQPGLELAPPPGRLPTRSGTQRGEFWPPERGTQPGAPRLAIRKKTPRPPFDTDEFFSRFDTDAPSFVAKRRAQIAGQPAAGGEQAATQAGTRPGLTAAASPPDPLGPIFWPSRGQSIAKSPEAATQATAWGGRLGAPRGEAPSSFVSGKPSPLMSTQKLQAEAPTQAAARGGREAPAPLDEDGRLIFDALDMGKSDAHVRAMSSMFGKPPARPPRARWPSRRVSELEPSEMHTDIWREQPRGGPLTPKQQELMSKVRELDPRPQSSVVAGERIPGSPRAPRWRGEPMPHMPPESAIARAKGRLGRHELPSQQRQSVFGDPSQEELISKIGRPGDPSSVGVMRPVGPDPIPPHLNPRRGPTKVFDPEELAQRAGVGKTTVDPVYPKTTVDLDGGQTINAPGHPALPVMRSAPAQLAETAPYLKGFDPKRFMTPTRETSKRAKFLAGLGLVTGAGAAMRKAGDPWAPPHPTATEKTYPPQPTAKERIEPLEFKEGFGRREHSTYTIKKGDTIQDIVNVLATKGEERVKLMEQIIRLNPEIARKDDYLGTTPHLSGTDIDRKAVKTGGKLSLPSEVAGKLKTADKLLGAKRRANLAKPGWYGKKEKKRDIPPPPPPGGEVQSMISAATPPVESSLLGAGHRLHADPWHRRPMGLQQGGAVRTSRPKTLATGRGTFTPPPGAQRTTGFNYHAAHQSNLRRFQRQEEARRKALIDRYLANLQRSAEGGAMPSVYATDTTRRVLPMQQGGGVPTAVQEWRAMGGTGPVHMGQLVGRAGGGALAPREAFELARNDLRAARPRLVAPPRPLAPGSLAGDEGPEAMTFQYGGGVGSTDSVRAMLTPGEHVIDRGNADYVRQNPGDLSNLRRLADDIRRGSPSRPPGYFR